MNPQTHEEVTEQSPSAAVSEVKDFDQESSKPAQTAHTKVGIDAERIRSSIARLTSNSTSELEKLIAESHHLNFERSSLASIISSAGATDFGYQSTEKGRSPGHTAA